MSKTSGDLKPRYRHIRELVGRDGEPSLEQLINSCADEGYRIVAVDLTEREALMELSLPGVL